MEDERKPFASSEEGVENEHHGGAGSGIANVVDDIVSDVGSRASAMTAGMEGAAAPAAADGNNNDSRLDHNLYATRKSASQASFSFALLTADICMLKYSVEDPTNPFCYVINTCLAVSIFLQVLTGAAIVYLGTTNINTAEQRHLDRASYLNNRWVSVASFLIAVLNVIAHALLLTANSPLVIPPAAARDVIVQG